MSDQSAKYQELIKSLNALDFWKTIEEDPVIMACSYRIYGIDKFFFWVGFMGDDLEGIWFSEEIEDPCSIEEIFDLVSPEVRQKMLYNLDLLKDGIL